MTHAIQFGELAVHAHAIGATVAKAAGNLNADSCQSLACFCFLSPELWSEHAIALYDPANGGDRIMGKIVPLLGQLRDVYSFAEGMGFVETSLPGVRFFWATEPVARTPLLYEAGIIIIGQGHKIGYLGEELFRYDENNYLIVSVPIPFECETHASLDNPLLGIFIDIDVSALHELVALVGKHLALRRFDLASVSRGIEPVALDPEMLDATERLLKCLRSPLESEALGRPLVNEITYRALLGKHGPVLYALTQHNSHYARVAKVLTRMHRDYGNPLNSEILAEEAGMSVSAFHRAFKQVTGDSPLQYLKKVRLNKAKSLIINEGVRASVAAARVGYESAPQFSREFKRYFKVPPSQARSIGYASIA